MKRRIFAPNLLKTHIFIKLMMKKVVYFLLALVLVALNACDNEPKFKVQGEVAGAADKTLYFEASGLEGIVVLDSIELGILSTRTLFGPILFCVNYEKYPNLMPFTAYT